MVGYKASQSNLTVLLLVLKLFRNGIKNIFGMCFKSQYLAKEDLGVKSKTTFARNKGRSQTNCNELEKRVPTRTLFRRSFVVLPICIFSIVFLATCSLAANIDSANQITGLANEFISSGIHPRKSAATISLKFQEIFPEIRLSKLLCRMKRIRMD